MFKNQIALDAYGCPEIIKVMEKLQKSCVSAKSKSYEKVVIPPPWRLMFGAKRQGPPAPKARIQQNHNSSPTSLGVRKVGTGEHVARAAKARGTGWLDSPEF